MPALPPYIIEPIWQQFVALLPARRADHPLGCHRSRIPDQTVFEKLVEVLVFGCAYERIADESCSATTLRRRRDEWIASGVMDTLREIVLDAYDRMIGLESSATWPSTAASPKLPVAARKRAKARWIGANKVSNAPRSLTRGWHPSGHRLGCGQSPRFSAIGRHRGHPAGGAWASARVHKRAPGSWLRFAHYPREAKGPQLGPYDLREGQAGSASGHEAVGGRTHELLQ